MFGGDVDLHFFANRFDARPRHAHWARPTSAEFANDPVERAREAAAQSLGKGRNAALDLCDSRTGIVRRDKEHDAINPTERNAVAIDQQFVEHVADERDLFHWLPKICSGMATRARAAARRMTKQTTKLPKRPLV